MTQVVSASEGHVFHNRLTHTLEVAQIARRLAERLGASYQNQLRGHGGLDPDVVEAAALAHDLGHPPFGHVAEDELKLCLAEVAPNLDGFEGNAQSFRIVTKLAAHRAGYPGVNLSRATLNAILKYPWLKGDGPASKPDKYGAYRSERKDFLHARELHAQGDRTKSLEAAIMDHADAIAYSVHDVDDFYRAGLIPLELLSETLSEHVNAFKQAGVVSPALVAAHEEELIAFIRSFPRGARYTGVHSQRTALRAWNATLINGFVSSVTLDFSGERPTLIIPPAEQVQLKFLQRLVWRYVIEGPQLATQQHGQRRIVRALFQTFFAAIGSSKGVKTTDHRLVPAAFGAELARLDADPSDGERDRNDRAARLAADIVASFTDGQAGAVYRRLTGVTAGSVTDLLD